MGDKEFCDISKVEEELKELLPDTKNNNITFGSGNNKEKLVGTKRQIISRIQTGNKKPIILGRRDSPIQRNGNSETEKNIDKTSGNKPKKKQSEPMLISGNLKSNNNESSGGKSKS